MLLHSFFYIMNNTIRAGADMEHYIIKNQKRLRCGVTTGTCAAAAAAAAAAKLLLGITREKVVVHTPKGIDAEVLVHEQEVSASKAVYMVIKDSGDDPDVTDGVHIYVSVEYSVPAVQGEHCFCDERYSGLYLDGGTGIGRVTRPGLEQEIGQAAINAVPREMIFRAVDELRQLAECRRELKIEVYIPEGVSLARKTFNQRLGIEGGLSVLGTSGILEPMSERAIIDTIEAEIKQRCGRGERWLLVAPGNYGQGYISKYLGLDINDSIKCSNYVGETLDLAVAYGAERFLLIGNAGKLVKLAAGIMNTHSRAADGRMEILAVHTVLCGGTRAMAEAVMQCVNTEEALGLLEQWGLRECVIQNICRKIHAHIKNRVGEKMKFGVMLFSERFGYLGGTDGSEEMAHDFRKGAVL